MNICLFYHSLLSDWNHGNAHFLRGYARELIELGHDVQIFEPREGWSYRNLIKYHGEEPLRGFHHAYPQLNSVFYDPEAPNLEQLLQGADLIIVHEWNDPALVDAIGRYRSTNPHCRLLFHDTHHRSVTKPEEMAHYDLSCYDGVLAFGSVIRNIYRKRGWAKRVWVWHEAADTSVFRPIPAKETAGDIVWIGNWGDDERAEELQNYLIEPIATLKLKARVHGVRYPDEAREALAGAGIQYAGWLPNYRVPEVFSAYRLTLHVPRRPYVESLPGIPTIRPFEAMACGLPLICSPWDDSEGLFNPGNDYLVAEDGEAMTGLIDRLLKHPKEARAMAGRARQTILSRHTCAHRVRQLLAICGELDLDTRIRQLAASPLRLPVNGARLRPAGAFFNAIHHRSFIFS